ncbi:hypothetical protein [Pseudoruegeria sp. SK021]|uniref:hypothetical protein n=1 Tax=Pseudoruegeria sp. SK021 TaxID=1933035 RepID=UPI000A22812A|nr:hypothetical protein [Pseudoruegeria sp. SK021]OSP56047.1 hypothetical protein BV911_03670 [Pseudoruegeria sp. SK021]
MCLVPLIVLGVAGPLHSGSVDMAGWILGQADLSAGGGASTDDPASDPSGHPNSTAGVGPRWAVAPIVTTPGLDGASLFDFVMDDVVTPAGRAPNPRWR